MKEQTHTSAPAPAAPTYLARLAAMVETVTDAAERLGVTRTRIQQLIREEKLEAVKVGSGKGAQVWVSSLSIQERLDRQRQKHGPPSV